MSPPSFFLLLLLSCLAGVSVSRPDARPQPKSAWARKARQRNGWEDLQHVKRVAKDSETQSCTDQVAGVLQAHKSNVWLGLTDVEAANVTSFLFAQKELNLTKTSLAGEWDNSILNIELMHPNKTEALNYIDGDGASPTRYAHVTLDHRASTEPYYSELLVGPLPIQNGTIKTTYQNLTYPYTRKTQGRIRSLDADDDDTLYSDWLYVVGASILDITLDLWNGSALGLDNDTLDIFGIDPLWQEPDGSILRWDNFWSYPTTEYDSETLLPLGLYFKSNVTGRDPSKWSLQGWLYNDVFYNTTEEFRTAFYTSGFQKLAANVEGPWADTYQQGPILPLDLMYPPTPVAPTGSRFFVDQDQKYVKWMDFEFFVGFRRDTGMGLYNIKYKGQRTIYELGLQEALAHYAGNDPVQSGTSYLDSYYGFGPYSFELVKGYDCPAYATYMNSSFFTGETTHTHIDSICLFEMDAGYPIKRHSQSNYVAVTKNIVFTIRNICTVGNYDYMFSYNFYLDGSIHLEVRASGYIQAAYYAANGDYGYKIHDALSGSMHDHVLNFKIDLDVLGRNNTMVTTTNTPVSEVYPWSNGQPRNTMKIVHANITNEDSSKLFWGSNGNTQYKVVNMDKPNKFGEYPGFRLLPSEGTVHLTVQNSSNLMNAANWATHDLFVTQQKDTEPRSAYPYNTQDVANPMVDFNDFFDGDSLMQTDVVVWANLGMHHIPHTGDLPNTVFTTAHSGIQIMPLNYLYGDPSTETVNQVQINYSHGKARKVNTFGQKQPVCELNFTAIDTEQLLQSYTGDVVIRKFPYNPNDPYYDTDAIV